MVNRSFSSIVAVVFFSLSTVTGCADESASIPSSTDVPPSTETPASGAVANEGTQAPNHELQAVSDRPSASSAGPSLRCNAITPIGSSAKAVRVRVSDEVKPELDQADVPSGTYVLDHAEYFSDRLRDNFTVPSSTIVMGPRSFEEVVSDPNTTIRTLGRLDASSHQVKLDCMDPAPANMNDVTPDFVFYSKDAGELTLERRLEDGVLRRVFRRQ